MRPLISLALTIFIWASAANAADRKLIDDLFRVSGGNAPSLAKILGGALGLPPANSEGPHMEMYEKSLSDEDARDLIEFFRSTAGQRLAEVAPKFAADARSALEARTTHYIAETKQRNLEHQTRNDFRGLGFALAAYFKDHQAFPRDIETSLVPQYTAKVPQVDAWGHKIRYRVSEDGHDYRLSSAGRDGRFATASQLKRSDDIVFSDGHFVHNDEPISTPLPSDDHKNASTKKGLIRELMTITDAQDSTADSVLDIIALRLGYRIAPEETRGEAREAPQMAEIANDTLVPLYSRYFSAAQLRQIVAFFKTESGEHYVQLTRAIAAENRRGVIASRAQ